MSRLQELREKMLIGPSGSIFVYSFEVWTTKIEQKLLELVNVGR